MFPRQVVPHHQVLRVTCGHSRRITGAGPGAEATFVICRTDTAGLLLGKWGTQQPGYQADVHFDKDTQWDSI